VHAADAGVARAQAWVPEEVRVPSRSPTRTTTSSDTDLFGHKNNNGGTHSQTVVTEVDYGVTDALGLTISLPFIASKYRTSGTRRRARDAS
jgi:hypothetical protein